MIGEGKEKNGMKRKDTNLMVSAPYPTSAAISSTSFPSCSNIFAALSTLSIFAPLITFFTPATGPSLAPPVLAEERVGAPSGRFDTSASRKASSEVMGV
jgi:hypothetical protein